MRTAARASTGLGYLAVAAAALLWATGATVARTLMDEGVSALFLAATRAWVALPLVAPALLFQTKEGGSQPGAEGSRLNPNPTPYFRAHLGRFRANLPALVLFGLNLAMANLTYYASVGRLPVAVAITIQYTSPALVVAWASLVARRPPGPRVIVALLLVLAGVPLVSGVLGRGTRPDPLGLALAGLASLTFAAYMVLADSLANRLGAGPSLAGGLAVASLFWAALLLPRGLGPLLQLARLPRLLYLGSLGTAAPFFLFIWGLARGVGAARAGIVSTLEPVSAALLAYAFLGQSLSSSQLLGGALVVLGVGAARPSPSRMEFCPPGRQKSTG